MSQTYDSMLWPEALGTTNDITRFVQVCKAAQAEYEEAGHGGSADIFSGKYTKPDGNVVNVAIKCIRALDIGNDNIRWKKLQKKLAREFEIWYNLSGGANIIELMGVITGIGPLPSFVCELCPWNLQDYLERKTPPPRHIRMMMDTLRGLTYMHGFKSGPIAHGDIKLSNILVTANETALICDFGRSLQPHDEPNENIISNSSPFAGTVRYMSPELFVPNAARPSPAADMWAYGCVVLESGEIPRSPALVDMFPSVISGPIPSWPSELDDLNGLLGGKTQTASSIRSTVWITTLSASKTNQVVVVKVPRLNASAQNQARHDHLRYVLRRVVAARYTVRHHNIIKLLGIASAFSPHEGLVFEYCSRQNLVRYFKDNRVRQTEYTRPPAPEANAYSLMCDILEGLKYMHDYPVPIPQGDLIPENILVGFDGRAKISLFSFGRVLASLPSTAAVTASIGSVLSFRWMSPELLGDNSQPTTESDMWTVGCTFYWILTGMEPYTSQRRDDFAGAESVQGQLPGSLANVDYHRAWITNGIWGAIGRCWRRDPLSRTSAGKFLKILKDLESRKPSWLPLNVVDLTGKVKFHPEQRRPENQVATYMSTWKRFRFGGKDIEEDVQLKMAMYRATYAPKWYSISTPVLIKAGYDFKDLDQQALVTSVRREITIMAQIDHPRIQKLLGIDSRDIDLPDMVFETYSHTTFDSLLSYGKVTTHERVRIVRDIATAIAYLHDHENGSIAHGDIQPANILVLPNGTAKLGNFTCSFQYLSGQPTSPGILSTTLSTPQRSPLYCDPYHHQQINSVGFALPTLAGDIWSYGIVVLSSFSDKFFHKDPDTHISQLSEGQLPYNSEECLGLDEEIILVLRSALAFEPADRADARTVLTHVSNIYATIDVTS
ncbi:hypothetical protein OPQ81_003335 [Rhizoctonia solani]|nr:hypothetical protein OPQ81_003335 [Rhizoctonia solani]